MRFKRPNRTRGGINASKGKLRLIHNRNFREIFQGDGRSKRDKNRCARSGGNIRGLLLEKPFWERAKTAKTVPKNLRASSATGSRIPKGVD